MNSGWALSFVQAWIERGMECGLSFDLCKYVRVNTNLFSGSLEMIICGELSPKFQMYDKQRLAYSVLTRGKSMPITECKQMLKNNKFETLTHKQQK